MRLIESVVVDDNARARLRVLVERVGPVRVRAHDGWKSFAAGLGLDVVQTVDEPTAATDLVVGPPAAVLRHAGSATVDFAFVMPVAQSARPWQRAQTWRDDATLAMWRAGWTPLNLDRVVLDAADDATIEFVIGDARRTPRVECASG